MINAFIAIRFLRHLSALIFLSLGWTAQRAHAQGFALCHKQHSAPLDVEAGLMVWQRAAAQAQLSDKARAHAPRPFDAVWPSNWQ